MLRVTKCVNRPIITMIQLVGLRRGSWGAVEVLACRVRSCGRRNRRAGGGFATVSQNSYDIRQMGLAGKSSSSSIFGQIYVHLFYTCVCGICLMSFWSSFSTNLVMLSVEIRVDSKGFWQWCITLRLTGFLYKVHRSVFYKLESTTYRKQDRFPHSPEGANRPSSRNVMFSSF
jgi:hypothetical protein